MSSPKKQSELTAAVDSLATVDRERLLRKTVGEESLEKEVGPLLDDISSKAEFALKYSDTVSDANVDSFSSNLREIVARMNEQASRSNQDYISTKTAVIGQLRAYVDAIRNVWPSFVTAAIEQRGFLQDEGIRKEYEQTINRIQSEATQSLERLRTESASAIEEARKLAEQIETRARRTAAKLSVEAAQSQFKEAQKPLIIQLAIWTLLSLGSLGMLAWLLVVFLEVKLPDQWTWQIVYYAAIRFAALATVGSVCAYCMRVLKAQLHMFQQNQHRQRVTNSIEAFVESAVTPEQRDLILTHMVDAVVSFGNSGLLNADNSADGIAPKLTIDSITRAVSGQPKSTP